MALLQRKQIEWVNAGWVAVSTFSATGGSGVVTSALTTALATAGRGATGVPLQPSVSEGLGVITVVPNNRVEIYDATLKTKLVDGNDNEVYGRITESGGAYTLTYYVLDGGTEVGHSIASAIDIDFFFPYRFTADKYPVDASISLGLKTVYQDAIPAAGASSVLPEVNEVIAVTAQDTLASLASLPVTNSAMRLSINGQIFSSVESSPAFTRSGQALTWSAANAGFSLDTTDSVIAYYFANA
jgi:hypothetical protein